MLDKKLRNSSAALSVFGISLITYAMHDYNCLVIMRTLQTVATVALLFAINYRNAQNKDQLVLFWLITSAIQCTTWCYMGLYYIYSGVSPYFVPMLLFLCTWLAPVVIFYMMYLIYQEYVELVQGNPDSLAVYNEIMDSEPPPYSAPTSENLFISTTSQK